MTDSIKNQIIAFKQGINEVIPQNYLQYLTENELQMHFAGMPELNGNLAQRDFPPPA